MVKWAALFLFVILYTLSLINSGNQDITIRLWLYGEPITQPQGIIITLYTVCAMLAVGLIGLLDRADLAGKVRRLQKEKQVQEKELVKLRELVTMERAE